MAPLIKAINAEYSHTLSGDICVYRGTVDHEWTVAAVPNGGYVLGLILESAIKNQSHTSHPDPIHVTAHFLRSATMGVFEVHIQILKPGRGFTNLTANLVQEGVVKVTTQMIFGTLTPHPDSQDPKMTLEPPSPYARRIPFHTHPSKCPPQASVRPFGYKHYALMATDPVHKAKAKTPREGMEWGQYLTLTDLSERFTTSALGFAADTFWAVDQILPSPWKEVRRASWSPTMVMTIEFKFPIPKSDDPDFSTRTVAIFSSGGFINDPQSRHDAYVEVWTAPSNIGEGEEKEGWKEQQRCLAVSTQMAILVPFAVNRKRAQKPTNGGDGSKL